MTLKNMAISNLIWNKELVSYFNQGPLKVLIDISFDIQLRPIHYLLHNRAKLG